MRTSTHLSRILYADTFILTHWADNPGMWPTLHGFLGRHSLQLGLGEGQSAELSDVPTKHERLRDFLQALPSVLLKTGDMILEEEVRAYPETRRDTLILSRLQPIPGQWDLADGLSSAMLAEGRRRQREAALQMPSRIEAGKSNYPPASDGRYRVKQAERFAWAITVQHLGRTHIGFLKQFKDNADDFRAEVFLSVHVLAYAVFYKYYLYGKQPQPSDLGDLFHLSAIPYCRLVLLERDMCNVLNHIKSEHGLLDGVTIRNVEFFRDWSWDEAR